MSSKIWLFMFTLIYYISPLQAGSNGKFWLFFLKSGYKIWMEASSSFSVFLLPTHKCQGMWLIIYEEVYIWGSNKSQISSHFAKQNPLVGIVEESTFSLAIEASNILIVQKCKEIWPDMPNVDPSAHRRFFYWPKKRGGRSQEFFPTLVLSLLYSAP